MRADPTPVLDGNAWSVADLGRLAHVLLARRAEVLLVAHRDGFKAGVKAFTAVSTSSGGCGIDDDGVWRLWEVNGQHVRLRVGHFGAAPVTVPLREVMAFALARVPDPVWSELARHRDARASAVQDLHGDRDRWFRSTFQPDRVTPAERAAIADAERRQFAAEAAMESLVMECMAQVPGLSAGRAAQLALFD